MNLCTRHDPISTNTKAVHRNSRRTVTRDKLTRRNLFDGRAILAKVVLMCHGGHQLVKLFNGALGYVASETLVCLLNVVIAQRQVCNERAVKVLQLQQVLPKSSLSPQHQVGVIDGAHLAELDYVRPDLAAVLGVGLS